MDRGITRVKKEAKLMIPTEAKLQTEFQIRTRLALSVERDPKCIKSQIRRQIKLRDIDCFFQIKNNTDLFVVGFWRHLHAVQQSTVHQWLQSTLRQALELVGG